MPDHVAGTLALNVASIPVSTAFPVVGAVVLVRHPRHVIGWLMCLLGAATIAETLTRWYAIEGRYLRPEQLPAAEYAAWVVSWNWFPKIMAGPRRFRTRR